MIPSLYSGGAEFVAREWIRELVLRRHEVTVYLYDRRQREVELPAGVSVHYFRRHWPLVRRPLLLLWLRRAILKRRPDAVVTMLTYSNTMTLAAALTARGRFPSVFVSERTVRSLPMSHERRRDRLVVWLARRLYRFAAGGLAISHPVAVDMVTTFRMRPESVFVIPNPIVSAERVGDPHRKARSGTGSDPLHLAFVGRLVEEKRPQLFVEVVRALALQGRSVRATIFGDGHLRASLEQLVSEQRLKVEFAGWRERWWSGPDEIDCVVVTSYREGFANVLVEAAREGIPCVAGAHALGVADAIIPGVTGELAMPDRASDYVAAVIRATGSGAPPRERIAGWLAHFSLEHSVDCLLEAIGSPKPRRSQ